MNSWDKSDSAWCWDSSHERCKEVHLPDSCTDGDTNIYCIGNNDLDLMKRLVKAGSDHRKFMRFITVTCDITAPLYWYKEFDTYKVGTVANSCSTMHKIHAKEFEWEDFSHEHLIPYSECYERKLIFEAPKEVMARIIETLNYFRAQYIRTKDKTYWWQMIQLLPSSYNQRRTVQMNYEVLRNMYHARKAHKLDEWREFCKWIETLPYHELITDGGEKNGQSDTEGENT
jgi:hypothetical protein